MAYDILTTSGINSLIYSYQTGQRNKLVSPLSSRKAIYEKRSSSYSTLSSKLNSLKTLLSSLITTGTSSPFATKKTTTSNSSFVTASATTSSSISSYELFVDQLAKSDLAVSEDLTSDDASSLTGTHTFTIKTGDGSGGEFESNVEVTFGDSETNETAMEAIRDAINADEAVVTSDSNVAANSYSDGTSTFTIDINGTETSVTVDGGGTYDDLIDELISEINSNVTGVTAEKVTDSPLAGDVALTLTVDDSDDYMTITHDSGFDLVTDLSIDVSQVKGASGLVTASVFTPRSDTHQFSITAKNTGLDYRITDLSDDGSYTALTELGLNLGAARTSFNQSTDPDTPGYIYSDITDASNLLNSKFSFNGLDIQKNSNSVDDLVEGTTFDLLSVMEVTDNNVSIVIDNDVTAVKAKIEDFISKFNDIYAYIRNESSVDSGKRGAFVGDSSAATIINNFQSVAYSEVSDLPAKDVSFLSQIGISLDSSIGLKILDSDLLESKIEINVDQVEALFNSTNGIANTLYDLVDSYLGIDGYLAMAETSLSNTISYLNDRISSVESRIEKSAKIMRYKYQRLQAQFSVMTSSQSFFMSGGQSFF